MRRLLPVASFAQNISCVYGFDTWEEHFLMAYVARFRSYCYLMERRGGPALALLLRITCMGGLIIIASSQKFHPWLYCYQLSVLMSLTIYRNVTHSPFANKSSEDQTK